MIVVMVWSALAIKGDRGHQVLPWTGAARQSINSSI